MHWLDWLYLKATSRQPLFARGFGDIERPLDAVGALRERSVPPPVSLTFVPTGALREEAFVASPAPLLLPETSQLHVVRLKAKSALRARVLVPPAWGDEGFAQRQWLVEPLRARGFEAWLFEGAYFGGRRAAEQRRVGLHTVGDFLRMGLANVHELRALVRTAIEWTPALPVVVAGYSMGGEMSAHAVASLDIEVPVVAMAAPNDASVVFCDGPLSGSVLWNALGPGSGERLASTLRAFAVTSQPVPRSSRRVLVETMADGIVPAASTRAIASHWGVTTRAIDSGHLGAFALHRRALCDAIASTLG